MRQIEVVEKSWQQFTALPLDIQRQVIDFIVFLAERYMQSAKPKQHRLRPLMNEPFVGMWQGREDMQDSSSWVRRVRQQ